MSDDVPVSVLSLEEFTVPVSVTKAGVVVDPTGDPVSVAVLGPDVVPQVSNWQPAAWETPAPGQYQMRFAVGPGSLVGVLTAGYCSVWIKVADSAETPVKLCPNRLVAF